MKSFCEELALIKEEYYKGKQQNKLAKLLDKLRVVPMIIYGAGRLGHCIHKYLSEQNIPVVAFCDTFKRGVDESTGLKIIAPEDLNAAYKNTGIIIGVCNYNVYAYDAISAKLQDIGFSGDIISPEQLLFPAYLFEWIGSCDKVLPYLDKYEIMWNNLTDEVSRQVLLNRIRHLLLWEAMPHSTYDRQYFESDFINLSEEEVFVDVGFYTGNTTEKFIQETNGKFKHIYGFEPDVNNAAKYKGLRDNSVSIISQGLWREEAILRFDQKGGYSSINTTGDIEIKVTSLDKFFQTEKDIPTYIKMDVEGLEKDVLLGAENTIRNHKPKLAICVYHKLEDIYELVRVIREFNPEYKFYLRHYSDFYVETVLYAVPSSVNKQRGAVKGIKGNTNRIKLEDNIPMDTPMRVLLEASSVCNFRCQFCPHGNGEAMKVVNQSIMSVQMAKKCIDDIADFPNKIKLLSFVSFGEPLVNRNLPEIITYANAKSVAEELEITTNASLLSAEVSEKLIDSGLSKVNISIYGLNDQKYREFSDALISFTELVKNIGYLYSIRKNANITIKISDAVCNSENEKNEFYRIFSSMCDKICIEHAVPFWYELEGNHSSDISKDIYGNEAKFKEVCPLPFFTMSVNADGIVTPCCNDWKNKLIMGDAKKQSLISIWNSEEYNDLRKSLLSGGTNSIVPCCNCRYPELVAMDNIDPFREILLKRLDTQHDL